MNANETQNVNSIKNQYSKLIRTMESSPYIKYKPGLFKNCACNAGYNKTKVQSNTVITGISQKSKISQTLKYVKGGKLNYGNFYLGQPLNINYLGRTEGMSGGSGRPPRNTF